MSVSIVARITVGFICMVYISVVLSARAEEKDPLSYEDDEVFMRLILRTPEQLTAFYLGREFNQATIDKILQTCFITPIVKNKKFDVLWLELDNWQFTKNGKTIDRIKRDYWIKQWQAVNLSQAHQSTFGWTLMPEVRDLRFDEGVGGSVVIPMQSEPVTVTANFKTGEDKQGKMKTITFKGVKCLTDESSIKQ